MGTRTRVISELEWPGPSSPEAAKRHLQNISFALFMDGSNASMFIAHNDQINGN